MTPRRRVVGKSKRSGNDSAALASGVRSVVERVRRDAYDGAFDPVFERHSLSALAVTGPEVQQEPTFLCQPGSILRRHACGMIARQSTVAGQ